MVSDRYRDAVVLGLNGQVFGYLEFIEEFRKLGLQVFEAGFSERFFGFFLKEL